MPVKLTTHILPGYDANNPMANKNLYLKNDATNELIYDNIVLEMGQSYTLYCNVKNEGDSLARNAKIDFYYAEGTATSYASLIKIGDSTSYEINGHGEQLTLNASTSFVPENDTQYQFYAVAYWAFDPKPAELDPTDRHIAGQTAFVGEKEVLLTLHDGLDEKGNSIGHNPNLFLEDSQNGVINSQNGNGLDIKTGNEYTLKARVVNNGPDVDNVQVTFYSHKSGVPNNPIAVSETAPVPGNGGEFIFSSEEKWKYENGQNELIAVCSTISDADKYTSKNVNPSDRHVAQHNVKAGKN